MTDLSKYMLGTFIFLSALKFLGLIRLSWIIIMGIVFFPILITITFVVFIVAIIIIGVIVMSIVLILIFMSELLFSSLRK